MCQENGPAVVSDPPTLGRLEEPLSLHTVPYGVDKHFLRQLSYYY